MYKSRLQEYCQSKRWSLPEYSTTKEGQDHCPQFKATVIVNGSTFSTPCSSKSSKEAHNLVASIACQHLIGSSSANNALQVSPNFIPAQQPKMSEPVQAPFSIVNSPNRDDKEFKDMAHLYKNKLQIYAQKKKLDFPIYISEREGPPHACRFKSKVMLEGKLYESLESFSTIKDAENAAAKVALLSVSSDETEEDDPAFFKNLLQKLAQKEYSCLPAYVTTQSGPSHNPSFSSTAEINGESFTGEEAKTKKLAEMNAAKAAYIAMRERKGKQNSKPDLPGYNVSGAPYCSSPKLKFIPAAELPDKHSSAPAPTSSGGQMEQVSYNEGPCYKDTEVGYIVAKPEVRTQNICGLKSDTMLISQDSPSAPIQSPSKLGVSAIRQRLDSSNSSLSHKKIKVFPWNPNVTLPAGATIMHRDEKWVAVSMDTTQGNV